MDASRIAIVGAGRVGSTFAYTLATSGLVREIVIVDADVARAEGEAMDIAHAVPFHRPVQVRAGSLADSAGAAVTVVTAGVAQQPCETRPALFQRNLAVVREVLEGVRRVNPEGLLLLATNPVDALTTAALRLTGLPPARVIGSGTVLDTARLRSELAALYRLDARNVHAYVLGEHGDAEFVAWSCASIASLRQGDYCALTGTPSTPSDTLRAIETRVRDAAYEIIRRKGATNFAIAASLMRIVEAIVRDEAAVLTVSSLLQGAYGIDGVCLSLPTVVGRTGVRQVLPVPLDPSELDALRRSAQAVAAVAAAPPG
jgi:L-lactate dehydrogenase